MEQDNKIIAEFMGVDQVDIDYAFNEHGQLKYHLSWDWLMPVIHKCFDVANDNAMADIMHHLQIAEMGETYDAVVEFIREYNFLNEVEDNLQEAKN